MNKRFFPKLAIALLFLIVIMEIFFLIIPKMKGNLSNRETAKRFNDECSNNSDWERCYADNFYEFTKKAEVQDAIEILVQLHGLDEKSRGCHLIAHYISISETEKNPREWKETLTKMDPSICTGGLIHGAIEVHSRTDGKFKITAESMEEICKYVGTNFSNRDENRCVHILGHLLLYQEEGNIKKATDVCPDVKEKTRFDCYRGIFMESETRENLILHAGFEPLAWTVENTKRQEEICLGYEGLASIACWRELSHMYVLDGAPTPSQVYTSCQNAPTTEATNHCYFESVGIHIISGLDAKYYPDLCKPYLNEIDNLRQCIDAAIQNLITSSPEFIDTAVKFCDVLGDDGKTVCYKQIGYELSFLNNPTLIEQYCERVPEEYYQECASSIN